MSRTAQKLISASGGKAYEIDQSLMFEVADSSYLNRTPSSASNQRTWTFSTWFKNTSENYSGGSIWTSWDSSTQSDASYGWIGFYQDKLQIGGWFTNWRTTNRVFRDVSAWMHLVVAVDTTIADGSADNRVRIYINGVEETSFATKNNPSQNYDLPWNSTQQHRLGAINGSTAYYLGGYLAETQVIDGSQLTPSSFGETDTDTGQWIPKKYVGSSSYGTNGYYMKYVSGAIGTDSSGEGNNYTTVNLANADVMLDTPTNNFPVFNPIVANGSSLSPNLTPATLTQGNLFSTGLQSSGVVGNAWNRSTFLIELGAWYVEFLIKDVDEALIAIQISYGSTYADYVANDGQIRPNGSAISYGSGNVTSTDGDIIALAFDRDNNYFSVYKNGSALSTNNTISAGDIHVGIFNGNHGGQVIVNFGQNGTFCGEKSAQGNTDGNGVGDFYYSVPSGYKALCTKNLSTPTIKKPTEHFNTVLYTGSDNDAVSQNVTGVGFQPDLVWIKKRSGTAHHVLTDAVRGVTKALNSNQDAAEVDDTYGVTAFGSDGFTVREQASAGGQVNTGTLVAWNWKANGSGSSNTDGSINTTATSANTTSGFSISTYTGTGSNATVGHGLGVAPSLIIVKNRDQTDKWVIYSAVTDETDYLQFDRDTSTVDDNTMWNDTAPTSSVFSIGTAHEVNASSEKYVAYCFAEKTGFCKIGSYTGNGSTNGPFINTGFRPSFVVWKRTNDVGRWEVIDNKRDTFNVSTHGLTWNFNGAENTGGGYWDIDMVSNGFKPRATETETNANGSTFLYMAFAESPFKYANAR